MKSMQSAHELEILNKIYKSKYVKVPSSPFKKVLSSGILGSISDFIRLLEKRQNDVSIRTYLKKLNEEGILVYKEIRNINGKDTFFYAVDGNKLNKKLLNNKLWIDMDKFITRNVSLR